MEFSLENHRNEWAVRVRAAVIQEVLDGTCTAADLNEHLTNTYNGLASEDVEHFITLLLAANVASSRAELEVMIAEEETTKHSFTTQSEKSNEEKIMASTPEGEEHYGEGDQDLPW